MQMYCIVGHLWHKKECVKLSACLSFDEINERLRHQPFVHYRCMLRFSPTNDWVNVINMYLRWSLCPLYLLACQVSSLRKLRSLLMCLCEVFWVLINSLVYCCSKYKPENRTANQTGTRPIRNCGGWVKDGTYFELLHSWNSAASRKHLISQWNIQFQLGYKSQITLFFISRKFHSVQPANATQKQCDEWYQSKQYNPFASHLYTPICIIQA